MDTKGHVDVFKMYSIALARLSESEDLRSRNGVKHGSIRSEEITIEKAAAAVLDRIKIMRVFDLVGIKEAVGEIKDGLEGVNQTSGKPDDGERKEVISEDKAVVKDKLAEKKMVADSEDEEDDEEMLFEHSQEPVQKHEENKSQQPSETLQLVPEEPPKSEKTSTTTPDRVEAILIDQLAHVLTPLLRKDYVHGKSQHQVPTV